ncbi:glycoside hydrolase family 26 protein [Gonapodya prolifera JEL478]|uniref:Glycoside hydrolase family 26 protein n=1 Tax=Gonapodya prolifera (strain JEL478) TaxID=1344416 RepID=A0A139A8G9_GONPJ|nr:glycoside hydrolase family 26 protein [Gonapodya prolifera JEL478]|eukprot:KXS13080.1 glycoside hydrolase family 26 protein [Gonapodya prolifera JEL478]
MGAYLDMQTRGDSPQQYASRIGKNLLLFGDFFEFPLSAQWFGTAPFWKSQLGPGAVLVMTLQPNGGLYTVTDQAISALVTELWGLNSAGIAVIVRFAHEMNGGWYIWGRQPALYRSTFQRVADGVHQVPNCAMLWSPGSGLRYPWAGGAYDGQYVAANMNELDTNGNGQLDANDDPYSPYYPGDGYVDWVGLSVYWYPDYPNTFTLNIAPPSGAIEALLTGHNQATWAYEVPDFLGQYSTAKGKPFIFAETGMHYIYSGGNPPSEIDQKRAWWQQLYNRALLTKYNIKGILYFEINKYEAHYNAMTPYALTYDDNIRGAFLNDLPRDVFF